MLTELTMHHIQTYVESCAPDQLIASPGQGFYCLAAQTIRFVEHISNEDMRAVRVSACNLVAYILETNRVDIKDEAVEVLLDEFDNGEWQESVEMTKLPDPEGGSEDEWVTRAQLEASGILPWIVSVA